MSKLVKPSLLIFAASSALLFSACTPSLNREQNQNQTQQEVQKEIGEMTKVMQSGEPYYCKLSKNGDGDSMEYWMKGKKVRMVVKRQDMEKTAYMISDSQYVYNWSEGDTQGKKMRMLTEEELKEMAEKAPEYADEAPDFSDETVINQYENQGYSVDCKKQNFDDSVFDVPSDIKFQDMSVLMEQSKQMMEKYDSGDVDKMQETAREMQEKFAQ